MHYALGFKIINGSSLIPRYKIYWVFLFQFKVSKDIFTPNEPNIMQWMVKSMQAFSEETRRLAINERDIDIIKAFVFTQEFCDYLTPTKMGLALHCHEELKLTNGRN